MIFKVPLGTTPKAKPKQVWVFDMWGHNFSDARPGSVKRKSVSGSIGDTYPLTCGYHPSHEMAPPKQCTQLHHHVCFSPQAVTKRCDRIQRVITTTGTGFTLHSTVTWGVFLKHGSTPGQSNNLLQQTLWVPPRHRNRKT